MNSALKSYSDFFHKIKKNIGETALAEWIDQLLSDAISLEASDLHFEPYADQYRIRIRQDGNLRLLCIAPIELGPLLTSRLKIMSHLDISERRLPQDGRFKWSLNSGYSLDIRISTCPTLCGEKIVLRLLPHLNPLACLEELGLTPDQKNIFLNELKSPQGLILVTGPTGSGKTRTLYTALQILNQGDKNISTAEDPIEIHLPGINQTAIHPKIGLTFSQALRTFLRQDPDVMMIGEIRDLDTADMALKAAQTGHLVLSTLHTNGAIQTLTRLEQMGLEPYFIASALSLLVAQRLVRKLCPHCKKPACISEEEKKALGILEISATLYEASGCLACENGYKGRVGLFEVLSISEELRHLILKKDHLQSVSQHLKSKEFKTLRDQAIKMAIKGSLSLSDLISQLTGRS